MKKGNLNGFGLAIAGAGVLLIWSAWRNWTIADSVRAAAALARGESIPPAGSAADSEGYYFAIGRNLQDALKDPAGTAGNGAGGYRRSGGRKARGTVRNSAPSSRIIDRKPI